MTVGERIREQREARDMTQTELAKRLGLSDRSSISKIEKSGDDITLKNIERIAEVLNINPSYLMGWVDLPGQFHLSDLDDDMKITRESINKNFESMYSSKYHKEYITSEEKNIISIYRTMLGNEKEMVKRLIGYYDRLKGVIEDGES